MLDVTCLPRGGDDARSPGVSRRCPSTSRTWPRPSATTSFIEYRRYDRSRQDQPAADVDPVEREDLGDQAAVPVPLDHLAADLDAGYEGLQGRQRHRAAPHLLAPPHERLVQLGGVDPVQPHELSGHDDGVAVDDLGGAGERLGTPAERQNGDETSEHSATVRCQTY